jgi:hypothetical protein
MLCNGSKKIKKSQHVPILSFFHSCIDDEKIDHAPTTIYYIACHRQYLCKSKLIEYIENLFLLIIRSNVKHNDHLELILITIDLWKMESHFNMLVVRFICIECQENIGQIDFKECGLLDSMLFKRESSNWMSYINNPQINNFDKSWATESWQKFQLV